MNKAIYHNLPNSSQGILWAILSCLSVSIMIYIVRVTSADFHVSQILTMRSFFSVLLLFPVIIKTNAKVFRTHNIKLHIYRGITGTIAMLAWFSVISSIPMPEAISLTFIVPILTTLAAIFILKEKVNRKIWVSLFIGFIGVLIITRPGFNNFQPAYLLAILSMFLWTFSNILVKKMSRTEKPETVVLYMSLIVFIFSIPFSFPYLKAMNIGDVMWFAALGLSANLAHISLSIAYSKTDLSTVQPFDFSRLIFGSIIAYFAFDELIDAWVITGSLLIFFATLYSTKKRKKSSINVKKSNTFIP